MALTPTHGPLLIPRLLHHRRHTAACVLHAHHAGGPTPPPRVPLSLPPSRRGRFDRPPVHHPCPAAVPATGPAHHCPHRWPSYCASRASAPTHVTADLLHEHSRRQCTDSPPPPLPDSTRLPDFAASLTTEMCAPRAVSDEATPESAFCLWKRQVSHGGKYPGGGGGG